MADETVRLGFLEFLEVGVHLEDSAVILLMAADQDPGTKKAVEKFGCLLTVAQATNLSIQLQDAVRRLRGSHH